MTLVGIIRKVLETPRPNAVNGKAKRTRRSPRYAEKLTKQVIAARKRKVPVKQMPDE
jgi:hypothetical protein